MDLDPVYWDAGPVGMVLAATPPYMPNSSGKSGRKLCADTQADAAIIVTAVSKKDFISCSILKNTIKSKYFLL